MRIRASTLFFRAAIAAVTAVVLVATAEADSTPPADTPAAAHEDRPKWTVSVDPLTTALGFAHIQTERALGERLSLYAGPHLRLYDSVLADTSEDYRGLGVEAGLRWFWSGTAPTGWWVLGRGVAAMLQTDGEMGTERAFGGYVSGLVGYTWVAKGWLVLSGGAGVQYIHYRVGGLGVEGVLPALHTAVGVAF